MSKWMWWWNFTALALIVICAVIYAVRTLFDLPVLRFAAVPTLLGYAFVGICLILTSMWQSRP